MAFRYTHHGQTAYRLLPAGAIFCIARNIWFVFLTPAPAASRFLPSTAKIDGPDVRHAL